MRRLVRYRQDLAHDRRNVKLRIRAMLCEGRIADPNCRPWTQAWLRWLRETAPLSVQTRWVADRQLRRLELLQESIQEVELRLRDLAVTDTQIEKLLAQPGIGLITAVTIRAEIGRFDRFRTGKQLSRFCGLSPRNASSGEKHELLGKFRTVLWLR